ncbi:MAG: hypothetical protein R8G33_02585 [Gammaproteobacteria bacterium]|nr:hypothetical protein [Gammaproteobacteria bacterium]
MLKKIALIYVLIELTSKAYIIYRAINEELFYKAINENLAHPLMPFLSWGISIAGLVAVLGYALNKQLLNPIIWKILLIAFLLLRLIELMPNGLFVSTASLSANIYVGLRYLWLVVPSIAAMWYLGFKFEQNKM